MDEALDSKVILAESLLRAGNLDRAKQLAQEVLQKQDDNIDAFDVLYEVRLQSQSYGQALALALWRLERLPNCPHANVRHLHALCLLKRKKDATKAMQDLQTRLSNHPIRLKEARLIYAYHFWPPRKAKKLIQSAKEDGYFSDDWLDILQADTHAEAGQIYSSRKMMTEALEKTPRDPDLLYALSVTNIFTGRVIRAIRQAKLGREVSPKMAPAFNEVIAVGYIGLCPLFWGAMIFIVCNASVATRLPWLIRIPFNYFFMALGIGFTFLPIMALGALSSFISLDLSWMGAVILFGNIGFALYLLFGFQRIGMSRANKKQSIGLKKDY